MNVFLWIVASLLAAAFLASGLQKLLQPKEKLVNSGLAWTADFSDGTVKLIGALELLGAIGLVLPGILGIATVFVPLAAVGIGLIMIGAIITHARRGEVQPIFINTFLLLLAAVVAWGRFGPYSF